LKRVTVASRLARPSAALGALLLGACQPIGSEGGIGVGDVGAPSGVAGSSGSVGVGGSATQGGAPGFGGNPSLSTGGTLVQVTCAQKAGESAVFPPYVVSSQRPARKVLYSWTTPEQVVELRRDRKLFIRSEQAGMGRGYAFDVIERLALTWSGSDVGELATRLSTDLFPKIRYAWPSPWATRMGWPGEDYGNQLVRIVLKDSAWTALVMNGTILVFDLAGALVPTETALQTPERVGAIFFAKDESAGGTGCGSGGTFGTTAVAGVSYREFILGNEAMVEEWSIGTDEILQQLSSDIIALSTFLERIRDCTLSNQPLGLAAACNWRLASTSSYDELGSYLGSLALPSEYYSPERSQIAKIIDTLEGDLFEPDPLRVVPGQ
jgi:hypothetical protein